MGPTDLVAMPRDEALGVQGMRPAAASGDRAEAYGRATPSYCYHPGVPGCPVPSANVTLVGPQEGPMSCKGRSRIWVHLRWRGPIDGGEARAVCQEQREFLMKPCGGQWTS